MTFEIWDVEYRWGDFYPRGVTFDGIYKYTWGT